MRISKEVTQNLYTMLAKASTAKFKVHQDEFEKYINTINAINTLDELTGVYRGVDLDNWEVAVFLQGFIEPSKVTMSNSSDEIDLKVVESAVSDEITLDHRHFDDITLALNTAFKVTTTGQSVSTLRKAVLLNDVYRKALDLDNFVVNNSTPFVPLNLTCGGLLRSSNYTVGANDMIYEYVKDQIRNIK